MSNAKGSREVTNAAKYRQRDTARLVAVIGGCIGILSSLLVLGYFVRDVHYLSEAILKLEKAQRNDRKSLESVRSVTRENQRELDRRGAIIRSVESAIDTCCPRGKP